MGDEKETTTPQGESNSNIKASDSTYALPEEARRTLSAWLFAKRLKQYRRMKQLEGGEGWREMPAVAREFHSSSPGDGLKVDETASADAVAFQGDAGPEVAFVERATSDVGDTEPQASDEAPVC